MAPEQPEAGERLRRRHGEGHGRQAGHAELLGQAVAGEPAVLEDDGVRSLGRPPLVLGHPLREVAALGEPVADEGDRVARAERGCRPTHERLVRVAEWRERDAVGSGQVGEVGARGERDLVAVASQANCQGEERLGVPSPADGEERDPHTYA